jgi:hypothetical protein
VRGVPMQRFQNMVKGFLLWRSMRVPTGEARRKHIVVSISAHAPPARCIKHIPP